MNNLAIETAIDNWNNNLLNEYINRPDETIISEDDFVEAIAEREDVVIDNFAHDWSAVESFIFNDLERSAKMEELHLSMLQELPGNAVNGSDKYDRFVTFLDEVVRSYYREVIA